MKYAMYYIYFILLVNILMKSSREDENDILIGDLNWLTNKHKKTCQELYEAKLKLKIKDEEIRRLTDRLIESVKSGGTFIYIPRYDR